MNAPAELRDALVALMRRGADAEISDSDFNNLALRVFAHQFHNNDAYRRYCVRRGRTPDNVRAWTAVPAVPTAAFKEVPLVCGSPTDAQLTFRTSGTTQGNEKRGTHYILDASLYDLSLLPTFLHFVLQGRRGVRMLSLMPSSEELPDSSLAYMITTVMRELGSPESDFYATSRGGIDVERLDRVLSEIAEPVCLLGTSLSYVHLLDHAGQKRRRLPRGSRLMDTGGFKGEKRQVSPEEMRERYRTSFGLVAEDCINEYGMTELCSQYYDGRPALKRGPPWLRARIVDPDTLNAVTPGTTGILQHFDLANLESVSAVQTEDLAVERDGGFTVIGRVTGAVPRGCSIAMDMLLSRHAR